MKLGSQHERILWLLWDGRPHFSAEFRDVLGLLEYRKPITRLRRLGYDIKSVRIRMFPDRPERPGYQLKSREAV